MLVIGELINSARERVGEAIQNKDEVAIRHLARIQVGGGAHILDVNTETSMQRESEDMKWVISLIHDEVGEVRLSIDSSNPYAMAAGLALCKSRAVMNSITNEKGKSALIELAAQYDADIIGLAMGEHGMPKTVDDRLAEARALLEKCRRVGIVPDRVYIDAVYMSVGTSPEQGAQALEAVRRVKNELGVKTVAAVSNVSFGLPNRRLLNRTYLSMLLEAGLDAAIMNPTDTAMMETIYASRALLGIDKYCGEYIKYWRKLR
ncbi:MAG: dihydropteroate synthase [Dehalococcoidia bacterium]